MFNVAIRFNTLRSAWRRPPILNFSANRIAGLLGSFGTAAGSRKFYTVYTYTHDRRCDVPTSFKLAIGMSDASSGDFRILMVVEDRLLWMREQVPLA